MNIILSFILYPYFQSSIAESRQANAFAKYSKNSTPSVPEFKLELISSGANGQVTFLDLLHLNPKYKFAGKFLE